MIPLSYNIRSLAVRKRTSIAAVVSIALVVVVFSGVLMLNEGITRTLGSTGRPDHAIVLRFGSQEEMSSAVEESRVGEILARPEVARGASGGGIGVGEIVVVATVDLADSKGFSNVTIRGVPESVWEFRTETKIVEGRKAQPGTDEVIIGKGIRGRFKGVDLGKTFELKKNRPVRVVGIFSSGGSAFESEVWADLDTIRSAFNRQGSVSSVRVKLASASKFDAFKTEVEENKQLGMQAQRESTYYENQSSGIATLLTGLGFGLAVFFGIGAMIGASITMYAMVSHRTHEVGTLRALGFSRIAILGSFLIESILIALVGGVIGMIGSLFLSFLKFSTLNFATWSEIVFRFQIDPGILVSALIAAAVMGLIGGFLPALRASRISPIEAMRA